MSINKPCLGKICAVLNYITILALIADTIARFVIMFGAGDSLVQESAPTEKAATVATTNEELAKGDLTAAQIS